MFSRMFKKKLAPSSSSERLFILTSDSMVKTIRYFCLFALKVQSIEIKLCYGLLFSTLEKRLNAATHNTYAINSSNNNKKSI